MKRIFIALTVLLSSVYAQAQTLAVINSDKILENVPEYTAAQKHLDELSSKYQAAIEKEINEIENIYNAYQSGKSSMTAVQRQNAENEIISREKSVQEKQKIYFGETGILAQKSDELVKPIKNKLDRAIELAAEANGVSMVVDLALAQGVVYNKGVKDLSEQVLKIFKSLN